jgi:uncharacterized membrane protein
MSATALALWSLFLLFFPAVTLWGEKRYQPLRWVGAMTICYLCGLIVGNTPLVNTPSSFLTTIIEASVSLAIPAMLFTAHPRQLLSGGKQFLMAFGFASMAAALASVVAFFVMGNRLHNSAEVSGMLASVYTGGTPNMSAVGIALGVDHEVFLVLNSADILLSGLYFAFLLTLGPSLLGWLFPKQATAPESSSGKGVGAGFTTDQIPGANHVFLSLLLAVVLLGAAAGTCLLLFGKLVVPVFILLLTIFSLLAASTKAVGRLRGTFNTAHYLLLIFALSIGCQADFRTLLHMTAEVLPYCALIISTTLLLHYTFCRIAGLTREISILASTAAVFGPPFVGPIAERLKAPHLILNGIMLGMLGYAIGNFLGIGIARLLEQFR